MNTKTSLVDELEIDRRSAERRGPAERRRVRPVADADPGQRRLVDRRKVERRRQIDPTTCERDYTPDQVDFMKAMDLYKRRSGRQFPTWSEVLEVIENLGYRKVAEPTEIYRQGQ